MTFDFSHIALLGISYLLVLFGIAYITDKGWLPDCIIRHPITYILSMGIFASAWAFYGVIDLANSFGYGALAYYLGTGAFFLFSPIIQAPMASLAKRYQLASVADLLTFRYHSQGVGALATLCMLLAVLPLMTLQIQAVADTLNLMNIKSSSVDLRIFNEINQRDTLALLYCALITLFCLIFGANPKRQSSMLTAMAFESLVKVCALLAIGWFCVYEVFGGFDGLDLWLQKNPLQLQQLYAPLENSTSHTLLLIFVATGIMMPHIFQIHNSAIPMRTITHTVTWAFPLFLLLLALPIYPILWAGIKEQVPTQVQYFTLSVPLFANSTTFSIIAFIGGLSAASGALIVGLLSISTMVLNHWVLPLLPFKPENNLYAQLRWLRRLLIIVIAIISYGVYLLANNDFSLLNLALLGFIEALQFLPGVIAISQWSKANRKGVIAGLIAGTSIWLVSVAIPAFMGYSSVNVSLLSLHFDIGMTHWHGITIAALGCNTLVFVIISLLTQQSSEERLNAEICSEDALSHPTRHGLDAQSIDDIFQKLAPTLGESVAQKEIDKALKYLKFNRNERRPYALRRLRDRLKINIAGLMGQAMARDIIDTHLPYQQSASSSTDINLIEDRLEHKHKQLTGIAADINRLRLYHRETLQTLPMAICSVGGDGEVLMWNQAMSSLTSIPDKEMLGSELSNLPMPWQQLITNFVADSQSTTAKESIELAGIRYWYRLHKSLIHERHSKNDGQVILIEDISENEQLEQELIHQGRLASIGRLAAGVAHEIGNPVTGIACLAQNLPYENEGERLATSEQILAQTERISQIVSSLVSFAHSGQKPSMRQEPVMLKHCVSEAIALLSLQKEDSQVYYHNALKGNEAVSGHPQRLIQVFVNLLSNARDASPLNGNITISSFTDDDKLLISVVDQGPGIPPEHFNTIMEPFFTTKEVGQGTGLGLALVYSIIEEHGAQIKVTSPINDQGGTCFTLSFPKSPDGN